MQPACSERCLLQVNRCLSIKGAEDAINKPYAFEISTTDSNMYFVADKDKVHSDHAMSVTLTTIACAYYQQLLILLAVAAVTTFTSFGVNMKRLATPAHDLRHSYTC